MALIKFKNDEKAKDFINEYNGKKFTSFEVKSFYLFTIYPICLKPESCNCLLIKKLEFKSNTKDVKGFPIAELNETDCNDNSKIEIPTCPVCLERMDSSITGLLTIICQHTFHCQCLRKWGDTRYISKILYKYNHVVFS